VPENRVDDQDYQIRTHPTFDHLEHLDRDLVTVFTRFANRAPRQERLPSNQRAKLHFFRRFV
jgi:hypothetical protein